MWFNLIFTEHKTKKRKNGQKEKRKNYKSLQGNRI